MGVEYIDTITVSGISGSLPICTHIGIILSSFSTYDEALFLVPSNDPNQTYDVSSYKWAWDGGSNETTINLYDSEGTLIATKSGIA